jgi:hypothetical protein
MRSALWSIPAVAVVFLASFGSLPAFPQSTQFLNLEARSLRLSTLSLSASPCSSDSNRSSRALHGDIPGNDSPLAPCDRSVSSPSRAIPVVVVPCNPLTQATIPCSASRDVVRDDLNTMGKQGQKILLARQKVLEILQSENACSEWYRSKDADPPATFRTLTFALDREGQGYVRSTNEPDNMNVFRSPYVAKVMQGQGSNTTVTINANGGFFYQMANVLRTHDDGGPLYLQGTRALHVGPYMGGTLNAQVVALLHEFGHVTDLLPPDRDDYEGKSRRNTEEVLRFCRREVESSEVHHLVLASH